MEHAFKKTTFRFRKKHLAKNIIKIHFDQSLSATRMRLEAVKLELIAWLASLEDEATIAQLKLVKDAQAEGDWWGELPAAHKLGIERGLKDVAEGRITSHEEVKDRFGI